MSTAPVPPRHALGMPAGSIRSILAFGVLAVLWLVVLVPPGPRESALNKQVSLAFVYLQFLMVLILGHFFTAHGTTIGSAVSSRSPLGLPTGTVRFLLLVGYVGLAFYVYKTPRPFELPETGPIGIWLLVMLSAFFVGHMVTRFMHWLYGAVLPAAFQDIQAWFALVSLLGLGILLMFRLIVNPNLPDENQVQLDYLEAILAGLVGFYFGARS
jgi:hypothetical protein